MEQVSSIQGMLLEGCVWDEKVQRLYFVDIDRKRIYQYNPQDQSCDFMQMSQPVSCIVLEHDSSLIAALQDGLYRVDPVQKRWNKIMNGILDKDVRFNDGKCDSYGNLWVGSMSFSAQLDRGSLYCICEEKVVREYPAYTIPNGLAWDRRRNVFYHIDTERKTVDRYIVTDQFDLSDRTVCLDLSDEDGVPDGMCMDEQGNLWIAIWGGGKVVCYDPLTQKKRDELSVPRKNVSCCTFGGADMNQLFITAAADDTYTGEVYVHALQMKGDFVNRYGKAKW